MARWVLMLLVVGILTADVHPSRPVRAQETPPSFVLVVTDDQRSDTVWAMRTVHREFAAKGVTFSNAFVVNAVCCPSRASLLTGRYSKGTGVYTNKPPHGGVQAFDPTSTIATWLDASGYRTALIGKYMNGYASTDVPPGWDSWFTFVNETAGYYEFTINDDGVLREFGSEASDYSTDVLAAEAEAFIRDVPADEPLFMVFSPFAPHAPAKPAPGDEGFFSWVDPHRPPSFNESDVRDKPGYIRKLDPLTGRQQSRIDSLRRRQLESLLAVDDAVRDIVGALRETGRLASTMVVFTSDNGLAWGEHRWRRKLVPYEESIRVPLLLRYDPLTTTARTDDHLALNIDIAPTIAELAGVGAPEADGRSLVRLLEDPDTRWRRRFLVEHVRINRRGPTVPTYCAVRTRRAIYVAYRNGFEELYRLDRDPYQLANGIQRHPRLAERLRSVLRRLCDPPPPGYMPS